MSLHIWVRMQLMIVALYDIRLARRCVNLVHISNTNERLLNVNYPYTSSFMEIIRLTFDQDPFSITFDRSLSSLTWVNVEQMLQFWTIAAASIETKPIVPAPETWMLMLPWLRVKVPSDVNATPFRYTGFTVGSFWLMVTFFRYVEFPWTMNTGTALSRFEFGK